MSPTEVLIHHEEFAELSQIRNSNIEKDFIFSMNFKDKTFWQKVQMGRFILEGIYSYKDGSTLLKHKYGNNYYWGYIFYAISKYFGLLYRIEKLYSKKTKVIKQE